MQENDSGSIDPFSSPLETDVERLQVELLESRNLYLRTLADFDNYRKRVERDQDEIGHAAKRDLLLGIVDVADNFERALSASASMSPADSRGIIAGVIVIYRQIQRLLEANGVVAFESVGEPFDPERHEAIGMVAVEGIDEGAVANEIRRGYTWNGKLLRPAEVQVAG